MQHVIEIEQVVKRYGTKTAVDHMSLQIRKGEIFGIVGPNGAGKTTLIEMMEGLRTPDDGQLKVLGMNIRSQAAAIKQRIGVLLQSSSIPEKAKVGEVFRLFASFYTKTADWDSVSRFLGLQDKMGLYVKSLSGGWKQRVSLALALINDPEIVFLDEPSMGLDPSARQEMWTLIHGLREDGRTIVVTTHYMEEAEKLCDRVAIISSGQLVALDTPRNLVARVGGTRRIRFRNEGAAADAARRFEALPRVEGVVWESDWIELQTADIDVTLQGLFRLAEQEDWLIRGLTLEDTSMNDVFRQLTSEERGAAL